MRWSAILINVALRLSILYFLGEALLFPNDPRFAGKAIPERNAIVVLTFSLLFPVLYRWTKRWDRYPFWIDNLYLSIFWLDMAGNSFDLYDRYYYFDLIPHSHGPGALAVVLLAGFGLNWLAAIGAAQIGHTLLEIQEYYTDVLLGTHNVRGLSDTVNDLAAGLVGMAVYVGLYTLCTRLRRRRRGDPR
ncbi:MAG TPA: hypothetical protein VII06_13065 [Chloroflexota bacterium]